MPIFDRGVENDQFLDKLCAIPLRITKGTNNVRDAAGWRAMQGGINSQPQPTACVWETNN